MSGGRYVITKHERFGEEFDWVAAVNVIIGGGMVTRRDWVNEEPTDWPVILIDKVGPMTGNDRLVKTWPAEVTKKWVTPDLRLSDMTAYDWCLVKLVEDEEPPQDLIEKASYGDLKAQEGVNYTKSFGFSPSEKEILDKVADRDFAQSSSRVLIGSVIMSRVGVDRYFNYDITKGSHTTDDPLTYIQARWVEYDNPPFVFTSEKEARETYSELVELHNMLEHKGLHKEIGFNLMPMCYIYNPNYEKR